MTYEEYDRLESAVAKWQKEKEDYELRRNKVFGLNPKPYLIVFIILFTYVFYIKDATLSDYLPSIEQNASSNKPTASDFILYEKPDNTSKVIYEDNSKTEITILDETKYFYKVELVKNGSIYKGYINKANVLK